jgi:hypothetical protein
LSAAERAAQDRATRVKEMKQQELKMDKLELDLRQREASVMAGASARQLITTHQNLVQNGKEGLGFGVDWLAAKAKDAVPEPPKATPARKQQITQERAEYFVKERDALEKRGVDEFSCLTVMDSTLTTYAKTSDLAQAKQPDMSTKKGREELDTTRAAQNAVARVIEKARDARGADKDGKHAVYGGRGTVLLEGLREELGFETVHIEGIPHKDYPKERKSSLTNDKDTRAAETVPNQKFEVIGADSKTPIDVRVGVDRYVKLGGALSPESKAIWEKLKNVEYGVGVADSGWHTFVISAGQVYEVHWDKGPTDKELTGTRSLDDFFKRWGSGVIAVPQGQLEKSSPRPKQAPTATHVPMTEWPK